MAWLRISPAGPAAALTAIETASTTALQTAQTALQLTQSLAATARVGLNQQVSSQVAILDQALLQAQRAIESAINGLLDTTGAYIRLLPPPRRGLSSFRRSTDEDEETPSEDVYLEGLSPTQREQVLGSLNFSRSYGPQVQPPGGNNWILQSLAQSLSNPADRTRPQFTQDTYWGCLLLVAGSTDMAGVVASLSNVQRLVGTHARHANNVTATDAPSLLPNNVRVEPSMRGRYPVLVWDPVPASATLQNRDGSRIVVSRYAVVRSTALTARSARNVTDLFTRNTLEVGQQGQHGALVLAIESYDGVTSRWVDQSELTPGETYYYHVVFETRLERPPNYIVRPNNRDGNTAPAPVTRASFGLLSNCFVYRAPNQQQPIQQSSDPTSAWIRTPSLASAFPGLDRALDRANEALRSVTTGARTALNSANAIQDWTAQLNTAQNLRLTEIQQYLRQAANALGSIDAGVYAALLSGQGAVGTFLQGVATALAEDDPERPPFDSGDEYTGGAVVVIATPSVLEFERVFGILRALLQGSVAGDLALGAASIPVGLQPPSVPTTTATAPVTFNEDMTPRAVGEGGSGCD